MCLLSRRRGQNPFQNSRVPLPTPRLEPVLVLVREPEPELVLVREPEPELVPGLVPEHWPPQLSILSRPAVPRNREQWLCLMLHSRLNHGLQNGSKSGSSALLSKRLLEHASQFLFRFQHEAGPF